jgi:3-(3-hydroxy-phenyl)propionate hydroxylase
VAKAAMSCLIFMTGNGGMSREYIQTQTIANKKLMEERDMARRQAMLDELRRTAEDPQAARHYMRRAALLHSLQMANAISA